MIEAMRRAYYDRARYLGDPRVRRDPSETHRQVLRSRAGQPDRPGEGNLEPRLVPRDRNRRRKPADHALQCRRWSGDGRGQHLHVGASVRLADRGSRRRFSAEQRNGRLQSPGRGDDREGTHRHAAQPRRAWQADAELDDPGGGHHAGGAIAVGHRQSRWADDHQHRDVRGAERAGIQHAAGRGGRGAADAPRLVSRPVARGAWAVRGPCRRARRVAGDGAHDRSQATGAGDAHTIWVDVQHGTLHGVPDLRRRGARAAIEDARSVRAVKRPGGLAAPVGSRPRPVAAGRPRTGASDRGGCRAAGRRS